MNRPWFPFYVGDYTRDTARLTTEAHGAYLLLILDYWVNGAPPDDDETLATIAKLPVSIWRKRRKSLERFFTIKDGLWTHGRIEKERVKAEEVGSSNSDKARGAAERRWAKDRERKLQEQSEQCFGDAPSIDGALPQNAQSQSQPPSEPKSKSRESNSPSKNFDVIEGGADESGPCRIDESYQPSDRATEYAFSLGMTKADLNSELSKFIATSMATRAVSFNIDMSFKVWCDRWLEFKLRREPNWKPEPPAEPVKVEPYFLVVQGTPESAAWDHNQRSKRLRPLFYSRHLVDGVEVIAARCPTLIPDGYDEATGEKLAPSSDEAAA